MLSDLAFDLAREGRRVAVVSSRQRYDAPGVRLAARETVGDVEIYRVWTSRFGRFNLVGRAVDYLTFYVSAAWRLWRLARAGDVVVAKTDPPMLSVVAGPIARLRRARLVNWLQDIFPEVAEVLGLGNSRLGRIGYRALKRVRNRSLKVAAMNVAIGERMADRLADNGVTAERVAVIPNWADGTRIRPIAPQENALRRSWDLASAFIVGYSGNLGRAHEYQTLLDAIEQIESGGRGAPAEREAAGLAQKNQLPRPVIWLFIGGGAQYDRFKRAVAERGLSSVMFQSYQPRERLAESLSVADVHLVSLRAELEGLIVPSKFYGVAAAGRPTIFIGDVDGEIAEAVRSHGCGLVVAEGDGAALAQSVTALAHDAALCVAMGARARAAFESAYDKTVAVARWQAVLSALEGRQAAGMQPETDGPVRSAVSVSVPPAD